MSEKAATKAPFCSNPPETSLRWCNGRHAAGFHEIDKAFSRCVILPPGVWEHFPKVTFAILFTHLFPGGVSLPPPNADQSACEGQEN